ncbi:VOC family protein [Prescottella agglutinans]|uniref:Catechol 2,3-dioxygenase-like lactoylglutathione lyase family enzyme n=1 Tax=Prescottella agglutinans TaxID=1644129 RepID=A0ABT6M3V6_9NOCA|nr:VOC family protein [Prescottella agglutinans]MDH6279003.1 catechol 2,3-dioxygenase-like lactoylglutathione lyase family enzyme [Prescottella agglutinans]
MEILSSRTILRPRDYEVTLSFYRDVLGLAVAREYPGGTVFFAGQGLIELTSHGGTDLESPFAGALWMQVRNLSDVQAELIRAEVPIVREARQEPWGLHEMWIADPDDIPIVLVQIPEDHPIRRDLR